MKTFSEVFGVNHCLTLAARKFELYCYTNMGLFEANCPMLFKVKEIEVNSKLTLPLIILVAIFCIDFGVRASFAQISEAEPIDASLIQLIANPDAYHGKVCAPHWILPF